MGQVLAIGSSKSRHRLTPSAMHGPDVPDWHPGHNSGVVVAVVVCDVVTVVVCDDVNVVVGVVVGVVVVGVVV